MIKKILACLLFLPAFPGPARPDSPASPQAPLPVFNPSGNGYAYVDEHYTLAFSGTFDEAEVFHEGRALVKRGGLYAFIDTEGRNICPFQFSDAGEFQDGMAAVEREKKWGFIDASGRQALACRFQDAGPFSEGLAAVKTGGKWGYIDKSGTLRIPARFQDACDFKGGLAAARRDGFYGFIDASGKTAIPFRFNDAGDFREGLAAAEGANGLWGYLNRAGLWVVRPSLREAHPFSEGLALVKDEKGYFFMDPSGAKAIPGPFTFAYAFSEGLAPVQSGRKYGYINKAGDWVIRPRFEFAQPFVSGWGQVSILEAGLSYVNAQGRLIWEPPGFRFTAGVFLYLLGLALPGFLARIYARAARRRMEGQGLEERKESYYRLSLKLNWIFLAYVFWFFAGPVLAGESGQYGNLNARLWQWSQGLGLPARGARFLFLFCYCALAAALYLAGAAWVRTALYRADRFLRGTTWPFRHYLGLVLRTQSLLLAPVIGWVLMGPWMPGNGAGYWAVLTGYVFLFVSLAPLAVKALWRVRPLDHPALAGSVERLCEKAGIRVRKVEILQSGPGKMANAMVSGLLPFYRYIFFTDYLLEHFSEQEIEAVLAHELGHIKRAHALKSTVILLAWMAASQFVYQAVAPVFRAWGLSMVFFYLLWVFLYVNIVFKFFSRIFERQADAYCVQLTGRREVYISALDKLAKVNFSVRKWTSLDSLLKTHPDIEGRIQSLRNAAE